MLIGDRHIDLLVEIKEKNNTLYRNFKKFENQCKRHPTEEKCHLIILWCKKMIKTWDAELRGLTDEARSSSEGLK